jgi:hypothetical protein
MATIFIYFLLSSFQIKAMIKDPDKPEELTLMKRIVAQNQ